MLKITLTEKQLNHAKAMGKKRHSYDRTIGAKGAYNISKQDGNSDHIDIQGCIAEYAVALALDKEWIGFATDFHNIKADVGTNLQVRSTYHPYGNLILHPKDKDEQIFILVRLHNLPCVDIMGWQIGKEVKQERYWTEPVPNRPCYLYPYQLLKSMEELE